VLVVGGGLAGCEAAWQLAERGVDVTLRESKPEVMSAAHSTPLLAEIVCSNSLRSDAVESPAGLLKAELRRAGSLILACADATRVPAGEALAVDRFAFARLVTSRIASHPRIRLERRVVDQLPDGDAIVATGPLTGGRLARQLGELCGRPLYFYDAIAPIVDAETIDRAIAFRASRWGRDTKVSTDAGADADGHADADSAAPADAESGDYLNCPLDRDEYAAFVAAVRAGRKVAPHSFEEARYFEGCLPIEVLAERGEEALAFGPMKPVGLVDPRTGRRPYAVVQLRQEDLAGTAFNLVGFQSRLTWPEQKRIFRQLPGLAEAEFLRLGQVHRNTFLDAPTLLAEDLSLRTHPDLFVAGQIVGVEGYVESCACGLLAARFIAARIGGLPLRPPPATTALGALYRHVTGEAHPKGYDYQPTNVTFGLFPPLEGSAPSSQRRTLVVERAQRDFTAWLESENLQMGAA
jgi:methylenetetrahydrofolate--tRNA-(uracil-5-)-methyltransferase